MLRRIELEVLATVDRGDTISELATKLDHSKSYLSVPSPTSLRRGSSTQNATADKTSRSVGCSRRRTLPGPRSPALPHRLPELLTGKTLEVLYYLDQPRTVSEIADRSDNYRNTVNRVLKRFRDRGLVGADDGRYKFNADFDRLHEFARELAPSTSPTPRTRRPEGHDSLGGLRRISRSDRDGDRHGDVPRNRPRSVRGLRPPVPAHQPPLLRLLRSSTQSRRRSSAVTRC